MVSYALEGVKWGAPGLGSPGGQVTWSFATSSYAGQFYAFDSTLTGNFQDEVRRAFDRWESVARIDFVEASSTLR